MEDRSILDATPLKKHRRSKARDNYAEHRTEHKNTEHRTHQRRRAKNAHKQSLGDKTEMASHTGGEPCRRPHREHAAVTSWNVTSSFPTSNVRDADGGPKGLSVTSHGMMKACVSSMAAAAGREAWTKGCMCGGETGERQRAGTGASGSVLSCSVVFSERDGSRYRRNILFF
jgi:hypothetical protein